MPTISSEVNLVKIIEKLEATALSTNDFLSLAVFGNFYELSGEEHRSSDLPRIVVVEWFEKAAATYLAALDAYRRQSEVLIPGFAERLEARLNYVNGMKRHITPYGQSVEPSERQKLLELVGASSS